MSDHEMTEAEIMKALEFVFNKNAILNLRDESRGVNYQVTIADVIDLINRKNAEIERLKETTVILMPARSQGKTRFLVKKYNDVRDETIKEFVKNADEVFKRYWGEKESVPIHDWLYVTARIMGVETDV